MPAPIPGNVVQLNDSAPLPDVEYIKLPLDHSDPSAGTFRNRFWATTQYYKPGGPVILYDAGEGNAQGFVPFIADPDFVYTDLAIKLGGVIIVWEHRYYGESMPDSFKNDPTGYKSPVSDYRWLTTDAALADVDKFAWQFARSELNSTDLTPKSTPWVFVGGSYPGIRAALMRLKYPQTIAVAYSASAPLQAQYNMDVYWEPIFTGMQNMGWGNCSADLHAAILAIDEKLEDDSGVDAFIARFMGPTLSPYVKNAVDLASYLQWTFQRWQSAGVSVHHGKLCNYIAQDPAAVGQYSDRSGWAATKGAEYVVDRWSNWTIENVSPDAIQIIIKEIQANWLDIELEEKAHARANRPKFDKRSWTYQTCTEWGFFQGALLGKHQLVSKQISLRLMAHECNRLFPDYPGIMTPDIEGTNAKYGGWNLRVTNTFTTYGQFDPWMMLGAASPIAPGHTEFTETIPECTKQNTVDSSTPLFGMIMPNGVHCADFDVTEQSMKARKLFIEAYHKWVSCR
jgi:hypothetical protein